ncbi:hypothetical protein ABKN59_002603 [Abortiporus biennis]
MSLHAVGAIPPPSSSNLPKINHNFLNLQQERNIGVGGNRFATSVTFTTGCIHILPSSHRKQVVALLSCIFAPSQIINEEEVVGKGALFFVKLGTKSSLIVNITLSMWKYGFPGDIRGNGLSNEVYTG